MEFFSAALFFIIFSFCALIGLPLTSRFIKNRFLALSIAKIAGLAIFGYFMWLGTSLRIFDYQNFFLVRELFFLFIAVGIYLLWREYKSLQFWISDFLKIECLSIILYFLYIWLRSFNPLANGTEHFMDMALLSASGKTHFFPFIDPWYAGQTINYYYYGSYLLSLLANLSGISYALVYNFSLGLLFSQSATIAYAIAFTITRTKKIGALAAFLVTSAGTLFYAVCAVNSILKDPNTTCNYFSSTRLFNPSYIINEIPSYSFTVGNLHAHLMALPFFLSGLVVLYIISERDIPRISDFIFLALFIATAGMINAWDFVTLVSLLVILVLIKTIRKKESIKWIKYGLGSIALAILLAVPFLINFKSPIMGIGFIPSFTASHGLKNVQYPTPITAILGIWGIFLVSGTAVFFAARKEIKNNIFFAVLGVVSLCIIAGVELFFIKDIYSVANPPYFRANTTFKFGYHAWVMLSIVFAIAVSLLASKKRTKKAAITLTTIALFTGIIYSIEAMRQYYVPQKNSSQSLDSSMWIKKQNTGDADVVEYINNHIKERSVIAEAVGDSYSNFSRITTLTGMITPMGWQTHEWTWHFQGKEAKNAPVGTTVETGWGAVSTIAQNIAQLYTTPIAEEAKKIIDQYKIQYIYVGDLEKSQYPALNESKFYQLGRVIFESKGNRLFVVY